MAGQGIDSSLSEIGVRQAEAAGRYLQDVHFTDVFASDMKRAMQVSCRCRTGLQQVEGAFELDINTLCDRIGGALYSLKRRTRTFWESQISEQFFWGDLMMSGFWNAAVKDRSLASENHENISANACTAMLFFSIVSMLSKATTTCWFHLSRLLDRWRVKCTRLHDYEDFQ